MATDTAPTAPARRHYWQLPTFALGVAAAAVAVAQFPPTPVSPADRFDRDRAALKQALDRRPADLPAVAALAGKVGDEADAYPASASAAHFLAGSGFVALAESAPETPEFWPLAARHLARVTAAELPDPADHPRLAFRLAKAQGATGAGDPKAVAAALARPPVGEEAEGERRRLLAEAYLQFVPPDLKRARDELTGYLGGPTRVPPAALARYRLRLGEIHLTLNEPAKARALLSEVGPAAPADVQASAKVQLARLAAAEGNWPEAVRLYAEAQKTPGLPADQRGLIQYQTGVGLMQLRRPVEAAAHFSQAIADGGSVGSAAAVRLAEITVRDIAHRGSRGKAIDLLDAAVRDAAGDFRNPHLSAADAQAAFEEAIQVCVAEADFASAVRAATAYGKVALAGRDREKRAEANAAWAVALAAAPQTAAQAAEKYAAAAADYAALGQAHPTATGRADLLRRAATSFRLGGDTASAFAVLDQIARAPGVPEEVAAAAHVERGDLLTAGGKFADAAAAYQKALGSPGPSATVARVKLGVAHLDQARGKGATAEAKGLTDFGQKLLAQAANAPGGDTPAERDARQQALFELGKSLFQHGNVADAEARFRQLVQGYPTGPLAGHAKMYLGSCLWGIAQGAGAAGPPADADRKLAEAAQLFESLTESPDVFLRTQADLRLANTLLLRKRYDDVPGLCERLAERYRGKVEELLVLAILYTAYCEADRPDPAKKTLARMGEVFDRLPKEAYRPKAAADSAPEYTREHWQEWFDRVRK